MVAANGITNILRECETEVLQHHLARVKQSVLQQSCEEGSDAETRMVTINCRDFTTTDNIFNLSEFFIHLCRKYGLLKNERCSLLSQMDQLIVVQLTLAEKNKEECGEFDVESSTVLSANNEIINRKLMKDTHQSSDDTDCFQGYQKFLDNCNYVDMCDIFTAVSDSFSKHDELQKEIRSSHMLILGVPSNKVEREMVKFLCEERCVKQVTVETPLENEGEINVACIDSSLSEILSQATEGTNATQSPKTALSVTESFVQLVFLSYLELLVNSRSELALARSLNVPERELIHTSFTDLKHEAQKKKMTMYQTALSFVMRIRLGGKGYQPDPESPLAQHVKGLGEYVGLIQRLQNIVEEEDNVRLACRKVLNAIKKEIVKCRDSGLRTTSVESVCERLQNQVASIVAKQESSTFKSPEKAARDGGTLLGRKTLQVIRHIVDKLVSGMDRYKTQSLDYLCDGFSSQKTPVRFPCLLSQFRSPDEDVEEYDKSLTERMLDKRKASQTPLYAKRYKSSMDWAEPVHKVSFSPAEEHVPAQSSVFVLPSKTLVHPSSGSKTAAIKAKKVLESINDQENTAMTSAICASSNDDAKESVKDVREKNIQDGKGKKRQRENASDLAPEKKKSKGQSKTCRRKLLPQVKGQQQIGKFFRV